MSASNRQVPPITGRNRGADLERLGAFVSFIQVRRACRSAGVNVVQIEGRGPEIWCLFRFGIRTSQGSRVIRQVMTDELSKISITNARRQRPFAFLSVTHGGSQLDELEFLVRTQRFRRFPKQPRVMAFRSCLTHRRMRTGARGRWGYLRQG